MKRRARLSIGVRLNTRVLKHTTLKEPQYQISGYIIQGPKGVMQRPIWALLDQEEAEALCEQLREALGPKVMTPPAGFTGRD